MTNDEPNGTNEKKAGILHIFLIACGALALALCIIFAPTAYVIYRSSAPRTDVAEYETVISPYRSEYGAHFPIGIPANVQSVRFFYLPGFLQGGTEIQLGVTLPASDVMAVRQKFEVKAIEKWQAVRLQNDADGRLMGMVDDEPAKSGKKAEYDVYLLKSTPEENWNHPKTSGVAISEKYNEVIYWLEDM